MVTTSMVAKIRRTDVGQTKKAPANLRAWVVSGLEFWNKTGVSPLNTQLFRGVTGDKPVTESPYTLSCRVKYSLSLILIKVQVMTKNRHRPEDIITKRMGCKPLISQYFPTTKTITQWDI